MAIGPDGHVLLHPVLGAEVDIFAERRVRVLVDTGGMKN